MHHEMAHLQGIPQDPGAETAAHIPPSLHSARGLDVGSTYFAFVVLLLTPSEWVAKKEE